MNSDRFVYSVIAVLICVVFIGSCLAPVVMDAVTGDRVTVTLDNDVSGATTFVYKMGAADTITGTFSTGEYTINAAGTDYTTASDPILLDPENGLIIPSLDNGYVTVYNENGIQQIALDRIVKVAASETSTWIIIDNGDLYGCGENSRGQQGSGDTIDVKVFTKRAENVANVYCQANNNNYNQGLTWYITTDGDLYGCGLNFSGQQGSGDTTDVLTFTKRAENVDKIAFSYAMTWYITTDGVLYGCGSNGYYAQGTGTNTDVTTFTQRATGVSKVACYDNAATWYVTSAGELYGCGNGSDGQQGSGSTSNVTTFTQRVSSGVSDVKCSTYTTWYLTTAGELYGCGNASKGQQSSDSTSNVTTFTQRATGVSDFEINSWCTFYLTSTGDLYGCGNNAKGQMGTGNTNNVTTFSKLAENVNKFYEVGYTNSEGATYYITTNDELYYSGTLNGSTTLSFSKIADDASLSSPSNKTVWYISTDGKLYGKGNNDSGQQGSNNTTTVTAFTERNPNPSKTVTIDDITISIDATEISIIGAADHYLITDATGIPNQYLYITDASTGYYAKPTEAIIFGSDSDSFFIATGTTIDSSYDSTPVLAAVNGTATQLSPDYGVYQYAGAFPITADGVSTGLAGIVALQFEGQVGTEGMDPAFASLLVLVVTFAIIGVVLAAVRMIGGRE